MKKIARFKLYDKLHKGAVITCMGLTVYSLFLVGNFGFNYYMNVKPQLIIKQEAYTKELLKEGSSETILDRAPEMKL